AEAEGGGGRGEGEKIPPKRDRQVAANFRGRRGLAGETWFPTRDEVAARAATQEAAMERSRELAAGAPGTPLTSRRSSPTTRNPPRERSPSCSPPPQGPG